MILLTEQKCAPCNGGTPPVAKEEAEKYLSQLKDWALKENSIEKNYTFKNFKEAMEFVNKVADIAEKEGHHPDIYIFYNKVRLELSTHAIGGLSINDFILAAKIDMLSI